MGQNSSILAQQYKRIDSIKYQNPPDISNHLVKLINPDNFKRVSEKQGQLFIPSEKFNFKFHFIAKLEIKQLILFNGFATITTNNRVKVFQGEFVSGQRQGFGIQYDQKDNILYEGFFKGNQYHGYGKTPLYQGQFRQGLRSGYGIYQQEIQRQDKQLPNKIRYEGEWKSNKFDGYGVLNIPSQKVEYFLIPNSRVEIGKYEYKYVGQWSWGSIQGIGKLRIKGQTYSGQFMNGKYDGDGQLLKDGQSRPIKGIFHQGTLSSKK